MSHADLHAAVQLGLGRARLGRAVRHVVAIGDPDEVSAQIAHAAKDQTPTVIHVTGGPAFAQELAGRIKPHMFDKIPDAEMIGMWEFDVNEMLSRIYVESDSPVCLVISHLNEIPAADLGSLIEIVHRAAQQNSPLMFVGVGTEGIHRKMGDARSYAERLFTFIPVSDDPEIRIA